MKVIEKNEGPKVEYSQMGENLLSFRDELFINLARFERDFDVNVDICENEFNMLTMGLGRRYVAQIHIPAREYKEIEITEGTGEEETKLEPVPFDMEKVTLTLWAIGGNR